MVLPIVPSSYGKAPSSRKRESRMIKCQRIEPWSQQSQVTQTVFWTDAHEVSHGSNREDLYAKVLDAKQTRPLANEVAITECVPRVYNSNKPGAPAPLIAPICKVNGLSRNVQYRFAGIALNNRQELADSKLTMNAEGNITIMGVHTILNTGTKSIPALADIAYYPLPAFTDDAGNNPAMQYDGKTEGAAVGQIIEISGLSLYSQLTILDQQIEMSADLHSAGKDKTGRDRTFTDYIHDVERRVKDLEHVQDYIPLYKYAIFKACQIALIRSIESRQGAFSQLHGIATYTFNELNAYYSTNNKAVVTYNRCMPHAIKTTDACARPDVIAKFAQYIGKKDENGNIVSVLNDTATATDLIFPMLHIQTWLTDAMTRVAHEQHDFYQRWRMGKTMAPAAPGKNLMALIRCN